MHQLERLPNDMSTKRHLIGALALAVPALLGADAVLAAATRSGYDARGEVRAWASRTAKRYNLNEEWILSVLSKARHIRTSKSMMRRPEKTSSVQPKDWGRHRALTLTPERIEKGLKFRERNEALLQVAEQRWGVPGDILTAVIGIETIYGKSMGRYRVLDVLATLSFDEPRRAHYFQDELAAFLLLCKVTESNPNSVLGSFAGAIGMCQFMPSSILKFGVDFDEDHAVRLRSSEADAIGSVANFLKHAGWNATLPVVWPCRCTPQIARDLAAGGIRANTTLQNMLDAGVEPLERIEAPAQTSALLIDLPLGKDSTIWLIGTQNFSALLEYNRSYFYAESVRELALAFSQEMKREDARFVF